MRYFWHTAAQLIVMTGLCPAFAQDLRSEIEQVDFQERYGFDLQQAGRAWQVMPDSLLYRQYLAGIREARLGMAWLHDSDRGWIWDATAGGRGGVVRYAPCGEDGPKWQFDVEGAVFVRLDKELDYDLDATDYRFGFPLSWSNGPDEVRFGFYHLSSHVGDEYLAVNPTFMMREYIKNALTLGYARWLNDDLRVFTEVGYAFGTNGGAEPWELQFGFDYLPPPPTPQRGGPFFGIVAHLREEVDFGGSVNVTTGWAWQGQRGENIRLGLQYYNGKFSQYSFFDQHEELMGFGIWYDF